MFPLPITTYLKLAAGAIALVTSFYFGWHLRDADFTVYKEKQQTTVKKLQEDYQARSDQIEKDKNAQIRSINNQLTDALIELRKRPSRAQATDLTAGGTGATLFAEDAIFLRREAARADEIRIGLEACYRQYDAIK